LTRESHISIEIKKSVFIADATPIKSAGQAQEFLTARKKQYPDATHHVYAWRLGKDEILQKFSDDGEPAGTAGLPVLDVLRKNDIEDAMIVVTRYFGGTQLGTGGLARAYGKAAGLAVKEAAPGDFAIAEAFDVTISYAQSDRLQYALKKEGFAVGKTVYGETPVLSVSCIKGQEGHLKMICADISAGQADVVSVGRTEMEMERTGEWDFEQSES
jgi:uncharacterized YigZ family protein